MVVDVSSKRWMVFVIIMIILLIGAIWYLVSQGYVNDGMIDKIMFSSS